MKASITAKLYCFLRLELSSILLRNNYKWVAVLFSYVWWFNIYWYYRYIIIRDSIYFLWIWFLRRARSGAVWALSRPLKIPSFDLFCIKHWWILLFLFLIVPTALIPTYFKLETCPIYTIMQIRHLDLLIVKQFKILRICIKRSSLFH